MKRMRRQYLITFADRFNQNLGEFQLNYEKVKNNILQHIKQKEEDLSIDKRRGFQSTYYENNQKYILAGFVTKKKKATLVQATSIWDRDLGELEVKPTNIKIIK